MDKAECHCRVLDEGPKILCNLQKNTTNCSNAAPLTLICSIWKKNCITLLQCELWITSMVSTEVMVSAPTQ